ncbi:MAG: hypothetical protein AAB074_11980 [Planctomycetota bacterium]
MNDDYLWDKSGRDPEIEAIENLLAPLAHSEDSGPPPRMPVSPAWGALLAVLATAAVVFFAVRLAMPAETPHRVRFPNPVQLTAAREIDLGIYGSVNAHEGAVVDVIRQSADEIRLRLTRGTIDARITYAARPRLFQVETPSTTCVDLGCHYTLTVEADGSTLVRVDSGQVAFADRGRETWVPADASCRAFPARGSGTPRWDDTPGDLVAAIEALDRARPEDRREAALAVIRACRSGGSALTLWHLAHDRDPGISEAAWPALVARIGVPDGVTEERAPEAEENWKQRIMDSAR